jgi:hypothetical protein
MSTFDALPPLPSGTAPTGLRTGTPAERDSARAALGFERLLLGELTKAIADPRTITGSEASGGTSMMLSQLPDVLADALETGGGVGLAAQLQPALEGAAR